MCMSNLDRLIPSQQQWPDDGMFHIKLKIFFHRQTTMNILAITENPIKGTVKFTMKIPVFM